jgi:putative transposase
VWHQFRDTQLTYERSWLARLKYTHENAVHHRLVADAMNYRWCSASWFAANARPAFVETVRRMNVDRVRIDDEY